VQTQHVGLVVVFQAQKQRMPRLPEAGVQRGVLLAGPDHAGLGDDPGADAIAIGTQAIVALDHVAAR
jgi:hypothetical protein